MFFSTTCKTGQIGRESRRRSAWRNACSWSALLFAAFALVAALAPRDAYAQQQEDDAAETEGQRKDGIRSFESVTVERIKPHDLPTQSKPGAPTGIRTQPEDLPRAPTEDQLEATRARVRAATVRVAKLETPRRPYRQEPRVSFGHAVLVEVPGTDGRKRAVISSLAWLADADQVFVVPAELATKHAEDQDWMKVRRRTLQSVTAGAEGREWYEQNRRDLVEVELEHRDKHRNLVTLAADGLAKLVDNPLALFPYDKKGLFYAYGYSPYFGNAIAQTTIAPTHPEKVALSFYFQSSFPAALGAPIVSDRGELVTITAFRHPDDANITLAIPTQAIESYLAPDWAENKRERDDGSDARNGEASEDASR
jgi:hypothetical protein